MFWLQLDELLHLSLFSSLSSDTAWIYALIILCLTGLKVNWCCNDSCPFICEITCRSGSQSWNKVRLPHRNMSSSSFTQWPSKKICFFIVLLVSLSWFIEFIKVIFVCWFVSLYLGYKCVWLFLCWVIVGAVSQFQSVSIVCLLCAPLAQEAMLQTHSRVLVILAQLNSRLPLRDMNL